MSKQKLSPKAAKAKAVRDENRRLRAEAKELLLKNKESVQYTKAQQKAFKKQELEELKVLLGKNKGDEEEEQIAPPPMAEPKQTNKPKAKKIIEELSESEESSEEEIIVKKKSKAKPKKSKKKVTVYLSSSDDESESDYEPPPQETKQKSRITRPNQIPEIEHEPVDYRSFFC